MDPEEIEAVAQAFYDAEPCSRGWHLEPDTLKDRFRAEAAMALAALKDYRDAEGASEASHTVHILFGIMPLAHFVATIGLSV